MDAMRAPHGGQQGGFVPQGGYGYQHGYSEPHKGSQDGFAAELRDMAYGRKPISEEFKAVVCAIMKEQTDSMLGQYGYSQHGQGQHGGSEHQRYKETLEELRDVPNVTEAVKRAGQYFDDLTDEDKKVLQLILNRPSYKKMAQMANMPPERFMEVKRGLEHKLKH